MVEIIGGGAVAQALLDKVSCDHHKILIDCANPPSERDAAEFFDYVSEKAKGFDVLIYFTTSKTHAETDVYCRVKALQSRVYGDIAGCEVVAIELAHLDADKSIWQGISQAKILITDIEPSYIYVNKSNDLVAQISEVFSDLANGALARHYRASRVDVFPDYRIRLFLKSRFLLRAVGVVVRRSALRKYVTCARCVELEC